MNPRDVFINCPFSPDYSDHFRAITFTVIRSGFTARCAREEDDGGMVRYEKICRIIEDCGYGIHDISKTELDLSSGLPRFNMPFELGLFLGAVKFGRQAIRNKKTMILDREEYRYQKFLSDIGGQDIHCHEAKVDVLIAKVGSWLRHHGGDANVPGGIEIGREFESFSASLPAICAVLRLDPSEVTFKDYVQMAANWIAGVAV